VDPRGLGGVPEGRAGPGMRPHAPACAQVGGAAWMGETQMGITDARVDSKGDSAGEEGQVGRPSRPPARQGGVALPHLQASPTHFTTPKTAGLYRSHIANL